MNQTEAQTDLDEFDPDGETVRSTITIPIGLRDAAKEKELNISVLTRLAIIDALRGDSPDRDKFALALLAKVAPDLAKMAYDLADAALKPRGRNAA